MPKTHIQATILFLALLTLIPLKVYAQRTVQTPNDRTIIHGNGTAGPYRIEQRFIGGTVAVDTLMISDIRVIDTDTASGGIMFNRKIAVTDSLAVYFTTPPSWLHSHYQRAIPSDTDQTVHREDYSIYREKTPHTFSGLRFGGSKSFEISTGSGREAALDQTLRLNISGNLTDDISLLATVSDQNVPISPEGTTRELDELERILIEIRGQRFSIDMGDTDLAYDQGRWLNYARRLTGARGGITLGNFELFGSAAMSEGRFMSMSIQPVEGNQGPYPLGGGDGRTDISIIPGTERIWVNGERQARGLNDDYTIDYATGEVTFTENRIVGSDMRIIADYEYTSDSYLRTFYSAGAGGTLWSDKVTVHAVFAQEADDSGRPILGELDKQMRQALAASGDHDAYMDGIRPAVSDTLGTYDLIDGHLVYNDAGSGEYNAVFSWIGEGDGSYRYRGGGIYEWVVPAERDLTAAYEPVANVARPVSHRIAGITAALDPAPYMHIEAEAAGSDVDMNTLSHLDDSNNGGGAYRVAFDLTPSVAGTIPLDFLVHGSRSTRGATFSPLDRDRPAEENRQWGLPLVWRTTEETFNEFETKATVSDGSFAESAVQLHAGSADFGTEAHSERLGTSGTISLSGRGSASLRLDTIERTGVAVLPDERITRLTGTAQGTLVGFSPMFGYDHEITEGTGTTLHGTSYDEYTIMLTSPQFGPITAEAEWLYRIERARHTAWMDSSTARGGAIGFSAGDGTSGRIRSRYARRERFGGSYENTSDQAVLEGFYKPVGSSFNLDASYRAGRTRDAVRRKNYIYAGSGRGSYRWEDENNDGVRDPDEFIPDEHGEYYLYEEILGDYRPVNMVHAFGRIGVKLPAWVTKRIPLDTADIKTETTVEINERSTAPTTDVFLLKLSRFRKAETTTSGDLRFQENLTVPIGTDGSFRLRYFSYDTYSGEYVTGSERTGETEESARLRLPLADRTDGELHVSHSVRKRTLEGYTSGNYRVRSIFGEIGISHYPRTDIKIGLTGSGGTDHDTVSGIDARYWIATPSATWFITGKGRLEGSYALTAVTLTGNSGSRLPYTMARGRREGSNHDISLNFDYRLSQRMTLVATYTGRRFSDRAFEHFAQAQLRAIF